MALAVRTCLPLLVSFCGPWFPLSCQFDSGGQRSRALNIHPGPSPAVGSQSWGPGEAVSLEGDGGEAGDLIHFGGEGPEKAAQTGRFQREEEKETFFDLTLLFNYLEYFLE